MKDLFSSFDIVDGLRQLAVEQSHYALMAASVAFVLFVSLASTAYRIVSQKRLAFTSSIVAFPLAVVAAAAFAIATAHRCEVLQAPDAIEFLKRAGIAYGGVCIVMSVYCAAFLSADKLNAVRNRGFEARGERTAYRIPEAAFHRAEFLGGWPGSLLAQRLLRHKVSKPAYQSACWGAVAAHAALVAVACFVAGRLSIASAVAIVPASLAIGAIVLSLRYASADRKRRNDPMRRAASAPDRYAL